MRHIVPILCLTTLIATSACNTVAGAGQDLKSAGQTVTTEAHKAAQ